MDISKTFGKEGDFTIRYRTCPDKYNYSPVEKMAICHLVIGNTVIGDVGEECHLPTWFFSIARVRDFFKENRNELYPKEFHNVNDREIYELIIKSSQLSSEFDVDYLYLPQFDSSVWRKHCLTLDETIDGFCTCYYIKDKEINFIIEKVWPEITTNENRIFFYKSVDFNLFIDTLDQVINFLETTYPYLAVTKG